MLGQGEELYRSADPTLLNLVLTYNLEYLGARASLTRSLSDVKLNELPNVPAELKASLHDLVVSFAGHRGLQLTLVEYAAYLFAGALVMVLLASYMVTRLFRAWSRRRR